MLRYLNEVQKRRYFSENLIAARNDRSRRKTNPGDELQKTKPRRFSFLYVHKTLGSIHKSIHRRAWSGPLLEYEYQCSTPEILYTSQSDVYIGILCVYTNVYGTNEYYERRRSYKTRNKNNNRRVTTAFAETGKV